MDFNYLHCQWHYNYFTLIHYRLNRVDNGVDLALKQWAVFWCKNGKQMGYEYFPYSIGAWNTPGSKNNTSGIYPFLRTWGWFRWNSYIPMTRNNWCKTVMRTTVLPFDLCDLIFSVFKEKQILVIQRFEPILTRKSQFINDKVVLHDYPRRD